MNSTPPAHNCRQPRPRSSALAIGVAAFGEGASTAASRVGSYLSSWEHDDPLNLSTLGYTAQLITHQGLFDKASHLITKIFTFQNLCANVPTTLESGPEANSP